MNVEAVEMDQLFRTELQRRFEIIEVTGGGNSLYNSLALAIGRQEVDQMDIRTELADFLVANAEMYDGFFHEGEDQEQQLRTPGIDGGAIAINLASLLYNREIYLIQAPFTVTVFQHVNGEAPPLFLSYHNGNHFNHLRPIVDDPLANPPAIAPANPLANHNMHN